MNTMNGGTAGDSIGYNATASEPFAQTQVYRLKICESPSCQKTFTTLAMAAMKICPECVTREVKRQAEMAKPFPPADGPDEDYWKPRGRHATRPVQEDSITARRIAERVLSMKVSA